MKKNLKNSKNFFSQNSEQASGGGGIKLNKPRCLYAKTNKNNTSIGGIL